MTQPSLLAGLDQPPSVIPEDVRFDGQAFVAELDQKRLRGQIERIYRLLQDGEWRTLGEIEAATGDPQASISAQIRHLRKRRFGSHAIEKRRRGDETRGLWEYRLVDHS